VKLNVLDTLFDAIWIELKRAKIVPYDVKTMGIFFKNNEQLFLKASCLLLGLEIHFSHFWIQLD